MEYIYLPNSDLRVSSLCLGCWQFNGGVQSSDKTWPAQTEEVSKQIVNKAIELGVNFFDTAEAYLNSEEILGRILEGRRRNVVVATKFAGRMTQYGPADIEVSVTNSLRKLKTDYIDLYQVHWPNTINENVQGCVDELNRQKAKGHIRHYAVSNFGPKNLEEFITLGGRPITNQVSYNLLWRTGEEEILPACRKHGLGILAYSPLMQGLLTGKFLKQEDVPEGRKRSKLFNSTSSALSRHKGEGAEKLLFQTIENIKGICDREGIAMPVAALSWCLQQDPVKCVIVGASSPQQVERNVQLVKLKQEVVQELNSVSDELKSIFGNNADLWFSGSRIA